MTNNEDKPIRVSPEEARKRIEPEISETIECQNRGDRVEVSMETNGRFTLPSTLFLRSFNNMEINDLVLSPEHRLIETLIKILNTCNDNDIVSKIEDALPAEFLEILIAMKIQFVTKQHIHKWECDCQLDKDVDEKELNEISLDLTKLNYTNIEESDKILKDYVSETFNKFTDEDFKNYLNQKYSPDEIDFDNHTIEKEVDSIKIREPFKVPIDGDLYLFRFARISDIIKAQKYVDDKYTPRLKLAAKQRFADVPKEQVAMKRKRVISNIEEDKNKELALAVRSFSLLAINGTEIKSDKEKIKIFGELNGESSINLSNYLSMLTFGLNHELELTCDQCGQVSKRWLQRDINLFELLPINSDSIDGKGRPTKLNILF